MQPIWKRSAVELLLPFACWWAGRWEVRILREGVPLDRDERQTADRIGVAHPGRIRLLRVDRVPLPVNPIFQRASERLGILSGQTAGMSLRYGIFVRAEHWGSRCLVIHEMVHTAQYERLGGIRPFLRAYLSECIDPGYPLGPLEQEAMAVAGSLAARGE